MEMPQVFEDIQELRREVERRVRGWLRKGGKLALLTGPGSGKTYQAIKAVQALLKEGKRGIFATSRRSLMKELADLLNVEPIPRKEKVCLNLPWLEAGRKKGYTDQAICRVCPFHVMNCHRRGLPVCPFWEAVLKSWEEGIAICHYSVVVPVSEIWRSSGLKGPDWIVIDEIHKGWDAQILPLKQLQKELGGLPYDSADRLRKLLFQLEEEKPRSSHEGYFVPHTAKELEELRSLAFEVARDLLLEGLPFELLPLMEEFEGSLSKEDIEEALLRAHKEDPEGLPDLNLLSPLLSLAKGEGWLVLTRRGAHFAFRHIHPVPEGVDVLALSATATPWEARELLGENLEVFWGFAQIKGELLHVKTRVSKRALENKRTRARVEKIQALYKAWAGRDTDRVISYKGSGLSLPSVHFFSAEGTNLLEEEGSLLCIGNPLPRPEALLTRGLLLFPSEEGKQKAWLCWQSGAELLQSLGRLRRLWTDDGARAVIAGHWPASFNWVGVFPALRLWEPQSRKILEVLLQALRAFRKVSEKDLISLAFEVARRLKNIDLEALLKALNGASIPERFFLLVWKEALELSRKARDLVLLQLEALNRALMLVHKRKKYRLMVFTERLEQQIDELKELIKQQEDNIPQLSPNPPPEVRR